MLAKPIITAAEAAAKIHPGCSLMVGGFMACGSPHTIIHALRAQGTRDLTLICNDTAVHDGKSGRITGVAHLVQGRQFRKIIASHIGLNQETQRQLNAGETEVDLVPQGNLAEQIRAGGAGLGGFLTPTGVGTEVAAGKQVILVEGRAFLLERPLRADVAIIKARKADRAGNLVYHGLANYKIPGKMVPGMGGAMDLTAGARVVIAATLHFDPSGASRMKRRCSLPLTAAGKVNWVVTDLGVFEVAGDGFTLLECFEPYTPAWIVERTEADITVREDCQMVGYSVGLTR